MKRASRTCSFEHRYNILSTENTIRAEESRQMADKRVPFKVAPQLNALMKQHFMELDEASRTKNRKIAWCSSVGPAELAHALGFLVYFPENHGAMLGRTRVASDYIPVANAHGYSPDICSYLTSDVGAYLKGETPLTKAYGIKSIPRPDVLLFNTNQCRDVYDWAMFYSKEFNAPVMGVNTPRTQPSTRQDVIKSVEAQMRELVPQLERISGQKFDIDKFREVMAISRECTDLWQQVLATASAKPAPLTF